MDFRSPHRLYFKESDLTDLLLFKASNNHTAPSSSTPLLSIDKELQRIPKPSKTGGCSSTNVNHSKSQTPPSYRSFISELSRRSLLRSRMPCEVRAFPSTIKRVSETVWKTESRRSAAVSSTPVQSVWSGQNTHILQPAQCNTSKYAKALVGERHHQMASKRSIAWHKLTNIVIGDIQVSKCHIMLAG